MMSESQNGGEVYGRPFQVEGQTEYFNRQFIVDSVINLALFAFLTKYSVSA